MLHSKQELFHTLTKVPLFSKLEEASLRSVASLAERVELRRNEVLFRQGDPGDAFFVVLQGSLKLTVEQNDHNFTLAVLGPLNHLGEMALIDHFPRSATAFALQDSVVVSIKRPAFLASLRANTELAIALLVGMAHRLRQSNMDTAAAAYLNVYRRLTQKLIQLAALHGKETERGVQIGVPLSAATLAEMIGSEASGVASLLTSLERDQVLSRQGDSLELLDLEALLRPDFPYQLS